MWCVPREDSVYGINMGTNFQKFGINMGIYLCSCLVRPYPKLGEVQPTPTPRKCLGLSEGWTEGIHTHTTQTSQTISGHIPLSHNWTSESHDLPALIVPKDSIWMCLVALTFLAPNMFFRSVGNRNWWNSRVSCAVTKRKTVVVWIRNFRHLQISGKGF